MKFLKTTLLSIAGLIFLIWLFRYEIVNYLAHKFP